ncbi:MAG: hypothetical protein QTN59_19225 [Candidatus Electrothrix communis]|nr:MAG: hypothetical protein QTN59_19225 [Candidatus Electrothrix communis]
MTVKDVLSSCGKIVMLPCWAGAVVLLADVLLWPTNSQAKEETWSDIWDGLQSSFALPFDEWDIDTSPQNILEDFMDRWDPDVGMSLVKKGSKYAPVVSAGLKFTPLGYWFAETSFYRYLDKDDQSPWNPDFVYRFGYEDWHPYTLSLVYSNYSGNRSYHDIAEKYNNGSYSLSWGFPVPDLLAAPFLIEPDRKINCSLSMSYSPRYTDENGETQRDQSRLKLTSNAPIYGGWYFSVSFISYLNSNQQQSWDPDYTFEFGWRGEYFSVSYSNYSGNRFPWRKDMSHDGGLGEGSISISWNL